MLREGRKTQLVSVRFVASGKEVVRATAFRVRRLEQVLPVEAPCPPIDIKSPEDSRDPTEPSLAQTPFLSGLELKEAKGSIGTPGPGGGVVSRQPADRRGGAAFAIDARRHRRRLL